MTAETRAKVRILIADDHAVVRRGVRDILAERFPNAVFGEAKNSQETLEKVWTYPWNLIILDITMPGRSGLDLLKDLRLARPKTPVLIQSMHEESHFAIRAFKAGAAGYITKQSVADELAAAAHKLLAGGRYVSATLAEKLVEFFKTGTAEPTLSLLSDREFQVLGMLASGKSVKQIAAELVLSVKTVSTYRTRILQKLNLRGTSDLVQYALRENLI